MRKFAVFDIDGTLIRWQLYHAIVDQLAKQGYLEENAKQKLKKARLAWKKRQHSQAFSEYEKIIIQLYEEAIETLSTADFDTLVVAVIDQYKDQVYTYTRDLLKELRGQGYFLITISGSHNELVEKLATYYGFDAFAGTKYERDGDKFSGQKFVASLYKAEILKEIVKKNNLSYDDSYGVGDSQSDKAFLELVENPIAFNPNRELYEKATANGWTIVVERKNVIYELTKRAKNSNGYQLTS